MRSLLIAGVVLGGCQSGAEWLFSDIPGLDTASAMVVSVQMKDRISVAAVDLPGDSPLFLRFRDHEEPEAQIEALLYEEPLTDLDIQPGALTLNSGVFARPLPTPKVLYRTRVTNGNIAEWYLEEELSEPTSAFRIAGSDHCPTVEVQHVAGLDEPDLQLRFLLPVETDLALAGFSDGRAFLISPTQMRAITVDPAVRSFNAGVVGSSGYWMVGDQQLLKGELSGGTLRLTTETSSTGLESFSGWMAVGSSSTSVEAFFLTEKDGRFMRYAAGQMELLLQLDDVNGSTYGGMVYLGPGSALTCHGDKGTNLYRYQHGMVLTEQLHDDPIDVCGTIARIPGFETLIGTEMGGVYEYDPTGQRWNQIVDRGIRSTVRRIAAFRDGLAVLGLQSWLLFYYRDRPHCFLSETSYGYSNKYFVDFTDRLLASNSGQIFYWYNVSRPH